MLLLTGLSQVVIIAESKSVSVGPRKLETCRTKAFFHPNIPSINKLIIFRGRDYRRTLIVKRKVSACQCSRTGCIKTC
ncbi:hypothetical protein BD769DRAFT_1453090, partial [Suillus cothurnatus]